ncbi:hypothetical protein [Parasitella parasitica]|uniref:Proteasome assembly chaperone 1 n=1 Tax=Parasitella parasitica TaxID=35722 RepID=A0A0B7NU57_9FUNG|nr:hypothetical protein [Parasitella parasitica]
MNYDDHEQIFASAPVRYALDDHDSDEENEACAQLEEIAVKTKLIIDSKHIESSNWTLILGLNGPGNVFINSLEGVTTTSIGIVERLFKNENSETNANISRITNQPVLLISFTKEIQAEEAASYTKAIFNAFKGNVEKVIVLDSFTATGYTSETRNEEMEPPLLRILQTSSAPVIEGLPLFEIPNMTKALAASILNYCEIYSIPCYDFLTLQESLYGKLLVNEETLEAYGQGFQHLGFEFKFNEQAMKKILNDVHAGLVDNNHHRLYL